MLRQTVLRPHDVAVALQLALRPGEPLVPLARAVGLSVSETHAALARLRLGRLLRASERRPAGEALMEFLRAGVPHAFPAILGPESRGVPTAHAAPPLAQELPSDAPFVWPSADGDQRGQSLAPLYPGAIRLPALNPALYELLALVDALRVGQARERRRAETLLRERLLGSKRQR